ncbi:hypothetical protein B0H65DRAFT_226613 [Neurospora tetraspora]|uniref:Uncharacterized protein n=1 Tax=Neurospora tetraspora TaxID=94610 RepID=A0AAE0JCK1_9PEZI|nr:hypothetical protein B0H65DRAFT_226613 [Neurospora tetraspora]
MKSTTTTLLTALSALAVSPALADFDGFFRFIGGNSIISGERLRLNNSIPWISPGVSHAPYNPADHYSRIYINDTTPSLLYVVPTNPHPPPVPGYYALSGTEGVPDAYRLVQTYRPDEEGSVNLYKEWKVKKACDKAKNETRALLRYGDDLYGEWRWIAVREIGYTGAERWVPWWVKPSEANIGNLTAWEYDVADLELVKAEGPVNSNAPGGVEEN